MAQQITIPKTQFEQLIRRIDKLEQMVTSFVKHSKKTVTKPRYGSKEWWEKETREGLADIKAGRAAGPFTTVKELQTYLDSLK